MKRLAISTFGLVALVAASTALAHPSSAQASPVTSPVQQSTPIPPVPPSPMPTGSGTPAPYPSLPPGGPSPSPSPRS